MDQNQVRKKRVELAKTRDRFIVHPLVIHLPVVLAAKGTPCIVGLRVLRIALYETRKIGDACESLVFDGLAIYTTRALWKLGHTVYLLSRASRDLEESE